MHTKTPITLRIEPELLAAVRHQANAENRTLTNFIETVLKERLGALSQPERRSVSDIDPSPPTQDGRAQ
jgi:hypothetical protein